MRWRTISQHKHLFVTIKQLHAACRKRMKQEKKNQNEIRASVTSRYTMAINDENNDVAVLVAIQVKKKVKKNTFPTLVHLSVT